MLDDRALDHRRLLDHQRDRFRLIEFRLRAFGEFLEWAPKDPSWQRYVVFVIMKMTSKMTTGTGDRTGRKCVAAIYLRLGC
jgi:hypothetical protein